MENLSAEKIPGNLKIVLKDGSNLIGSLPCDAPDDYHIIFLPLEMAGEFNKRFKPNTFIKFDEIKGFVKVIPKALIKSYEILENTLKDLKTENNKPLPHNMDIFIEKSLLPGYVNIKYQIPNHNIKFDLGDLKIIQGSVTLPITLVFLSYAKEDKTMVEFVMKNLHDNGVTTWYDNKDLLPGDLWEEKILNGIDKADYVFVFLSSKTLNRAGYKNKELRYILDQYSLKPFGKKYIIPILLDDCNPPRELSQIQWLKISENGWMKKLLAAIGK